MTLFASAAAAAAESGMNVWILGALIVVYMLIVGYLGYRGFRKTASNKDYLLAGRSVNPFVMAMSYGAAFISTSALVGFGGVAGQFGEERHAKAVLDITRAHHAALDAFGEARLGELKCDE